VKRKEKKGDSGVCLYIEAKRWGIGGKPTETRGNSLSNCIESKREKKYPIEREKCYLREGKTKRGLVDVHRLVGKKGKKFVG